MAKILPAQEGSAPPLTTVSPEQLEALLVRLELLLPKELWEQVASLLRTLQGVMALLERKNTTLARLRRWLFGATSEKTSRVFPKPLPTGAAAPAPPKPRRKGHGRRGAAEYVGAKVVVVAHPSLRVGDLCSDCQKPQGKLRLWPPSALVRITAQPIFAATKFVLEQLRCQLCGKLFRAPAPPEAGQAKYDPNVGVMLGLMRYGSGLPHYRMERMQEDWGVPLPQSTQWELLAQSARDFAPIGQELITVAACGQLLHNDDTTMRVQSLRREKAQEETERQGIFTTSIIAKVGLQQVALFFTGGDHAGENLDLVLKKRDPELEKPIQMCDALSRNCSKEFEVLLSHCLPHGRRNFVDVAESFPTECRKVLESLAEVFQHEAQAKAGNLTPQERLRLHQEHSQPVMEALRAWMQEQMDQKKVEPNSGLGQAIRYMLKHWEPLTLFLRHPGAPLDNNICERALKMSILHRKNSLSYKTARGAQIGDLFMSLIHTCRLNQLNPFAYLEALRVHAKAVQANPRQWLPWTYKQTLAALAPS